MNIVATVVGRMVLGYRSRTITGASTMVRKPSRIASANASMSKAKPEVRVGRDLLDDRRRVDLQPDLRAAHGEAEELAREPAVAPAIDAARRRSSRFRET